MFDVELDVVEVALVVVVASTRDWEQQIEQHSSHRVDFEFVVAATRGALLALVHNTAPW